MKHSPAVKSRLLFAAWLAAAAVTGASAAAETGPADLAPLGAHYLDNGDFENALRVIRLMRCPDGPYPPEALALLQRLADDFEREKERVRLVSAIVREKAAAVRELVAVMRPALLFQRAGELTAEGHYEAAAALYEEAIGTQPVAAARHDYETAYLAFARTVSRAALDRGTLSPEKAGRLVARAHRFVAAREQLAADPPGDHAPGDAGGP